MARINARDFVGTRARFQRLSDAKIFNGWIESFFGNNIDLSTSTDAAVEVGDEFRVEGFGHHISVVFNAKLEGIASLDVMSSGILTEIEGSNATILQAKKVTFQMVVVSPVRFAASTESVRISVPDLFLKIKKGPFDHDGFAVDVAPNGIGLLTKEEFEPNQPTTVTIDTNVGTVTAACSIRYCRKDKDREGYNRVGVMFTDLGRVDRPRWERFLKEIN